MQSDKYGRTYHFPFSPGTSSDDKILKDWQNILNHELIVTEKLDGENTCLKESGVYARSHAAPTRNPWAANMWDIWKCLKNDLKSLEIFGENLYGLHSIEYTNLEHYFFVFAIRDGDKWLAWDEVCFYAKVLNLPTVPVIIKDYFNEKSLENFIKNEITKGSKLGGECEGFVVRNNGDFTSDSFKHNVIKYVRKNHVKTDEHWTRNWKRAKLVYEFSK